jgi:ABC-2 type transport system ATP-binding protein
LQHALEQHGLPVRTSGDGTLRVDADPTTVGEIAFAAGVPLTELRSCESEGLEEMFLQLTANDARDHHPERTAV